MTIKALFPTVRPTLNLDFAKTKALDPRVTFTRASTASFVGANGLIQTAASGVPRFDHNPATGESLGLLVEEARTNSLTYSEQFNNAAWGKTNVTITANTSVAPDGTTTADSMIEASGSQATFRINQSGGESTFSLFAKEIPGSAKRYLYFGIGVTSNDRWAYAVVDLSTGSFVSKNDPFQHSITNVKVDSYPNGWKRVSAYCSSPLGDKPFYIGLTDSANPTVTTSNIPYTGDGTSGIYIWGAQSEVSFTFPTSYIPTTTATVTRAADVASMTGTNFSSWFNRNNGTLLCNAQNLNAEPNPPLILTAAAYYQGAGGYKLGLAGFWSSVSQLSTDAWANGVSLGGSAINVSETQAVSATIRHSFAYSPTECRACVKQTLGTVGGSQCFQAAQGLDRLLFQQYFSVTSSRINRIAFYPVRLPDTQLQAITAT